jgi:hypothetical protein
MWLDRVSDTDLTDLHRLSKELLMVMYRANLHDVLLTDLLGEFEQQVDHTRRARLTRKIPRRTSSGSEHSAHLP